MLSNITPPQMKRVHQLLNSLKLMEQKAALCWSYSSNRTASIKELTSGEALALIRYLEKEHKAKELQQAEGVKRMRAKALGICTDLGWLKTEKQLGRKLTPADYATLNKFMLEKSYLKKQLSKYSFQELPKLISQLESILNQDEQKLKKQLGTLNNVKPS